MHHGAPSATAARDAGGSVMQITPKRSACQRLTADRQFWAVIDALGITTTHLIDHDLAPRTFACQGFRASREDPAAYLAWSRCVLPGGDNDGWGTSRTIVPPQASLHAEQEAGDMLLTFARLGTGADAQALRRWLQLWGWEPPPAMRRDPDPSHMVL